MILLPEFEFDEAKSRTDAEKHGYRGSVVRLISVRRARPQEVAEHGRE